VRTVACLLTVSPNRLTVFVLFHFAPVQNRLTLVEKHSLVRGFDDSTALLWGTLLVAQLVKALRY